MAACFGFLRCGMVDNAFLSRCGGCYSMLMVPRYEDEGSIGVLKSLDFLYCSRRSCLRSTLCILS